MLARSGPLPTRGHYSYEVKWDGFRGILSTENGLPIRSRRGWDMTGLLPELVSFPTFGIFDGELAPSTPTARRISRSCANGCSCAADRSTSST
jgi:ATP-dependent DNA ligase